MTVAYLFGSVLFSLVGMAAFGYGKRMASLKTMVIGGVLMVFPYVVPNAILLYVIGAALTAALFYYRD